MIAEDGNNEEGVWKEKKARIPLFWPEVVDSVDRRCRGCECRSEKKVRKTGRAIKQSSKRTRRGDRIFTMKGLLGSECLVSATERRLTAGEMQRCHAPDRGHME